MFFRNKWSIMTFVNFLEFYAAKLNNNYHVRNKN